MFFREYHTPPLLAPYIRCYWTLEIEASHGPHVGQSQRFLAEGLEFMFNIAEPVIIENNDGSAKTMTESGVTGPLSRPMRLRPTGSLNLFGICFRPGGSYPFFKIPAHELVDQFPDVGDLWGSKGCKFVERIQNDCLTTRSRIEALSGYLSNLLCKNLRDDAVINAAIEFIDNLKGRISIDDLARCLGLSCRHLERKFKERIGMTPKQLCRNTRFKHTYKRIEASHRANWVDMALTCGYYDQAHLINEFRYFTGTSPADFFKSASPVPDFFTANF
jgi:AraC-like DNA-binding protein